MSRPLRAADRVVAVVSGGVQGSGVLLGPFTVLTCAHILVDPDETTVTSPVLGRPVRPVAETVSSEHDLALLTLEWKADVEEPFPRLSRPRVGRVTTRAPIPDCEIVGFPDIQRQGPEGRLEYEHFQGTVLPMAGRIGGALTFELARPSLAEPDGDDSPLAGLSGAPIFAGEVLLGIVREIPRGRTHTRIVGASLGRAEPAWSPGPAWTPEPSWTFGLDAAATPHWEEITESHARDQDFEDGYARAVRARYRKTKIFGIDELDTRETSWELDTAYVSLEAEAAPRSSDHVRTSSTGASGPRRIHDLLSDRPRVLLRGEAGAGKTTLVWWLAAHAASSTLGPELDELNGLVPFVVPLRNVRAQGGAFPDPTALPQVAKLQTGPAPEGWAARVLASGRALLLVDGLDEVPTSDRAAARDWLAELLDLYPKVRCLATVRPGAVDPDWLRAERFEELTLLPMRDEDIHAFVAAWHRTARLEWDGHPDWHRGREEQAVLVELEQDLVQQFARNPALRILARTPLLCAVICALHRRRGGLLPSTRWELYQAALGMLLGARDKQRRIGTPEGIEMGVEEHLELFQTVAAWLVRTGQNQLCREEAEKQIAQTLRVMPHVRKQGPPGAVLTHLVNRSGLLQERADDAVQFIHRTFQDYLAAKAFVESGAVKELLIHAADEQWRDVIRLAVGHCRPAERTALIEGLIERGDALPSGAEQRAGLHILAAQCALETVVLADHVRQAVDDRIRAVVASATNTSLGRLPSLGPDLLPYLPDADGLAEPVARKIARLIGLVGGREAIPYARRFVGHPSRTVRKILAAHWVNFPLENYADDVLAGLRLDDVTVEVHSVPQLNLLRRLGPMGGVAVIGRYSESCLGSQLAGLTVDRLLLCANDRLMDLGFLRQLTAVRNLTLLKCPTAVWALRRLNRASQISQLALQVPSFSEFRRLEEPLHRVRELDAEATHDVSGTGEIARMFPSLTDLTLRFDEASAAELDLEPLAALPSLRLRLMRLRR